MGYIIKSSGIIESGTWTPVLISSSSEITSTIFTRAYYTRINNIVNCTIQATANFNFVFNTVANIVFTVPIPTTSVEPIGLGTLIANTYFPINISSYQIVGTNCKYDFRCGSFVNIGAGYSLSFQYEIN